MDSKIKVSYSQYSTYQHCPFKWKLDYMLKKRTFKGNINTTFGTAIHVALQEFLCERYHNKNTLSYDAVVNIFINKFKEEYTALNLDENQSDNNNAENFDSFCEDGKNVLYEILAPINLNRIFPLNKYSLIGTELPLSINLINNTQFIGFIDVLLKENLTNKYKIVDFKLSTSGWNQYALNDETKLSQLYIYKHVYAKQFNIPEDDISVEFCILKRKLLKEQFFSQSRIQLYSPRCSKVIINKCVKSFVKFLNNCFTKTGNYNETGMFPKYTGRAHSNCRFCEYYKKECDGIASKLKNDYEFVYD